VVNRFGNLKFVFYCFGLYTIAGVVSFALLLVAKRCWLFFYLCFVVDVWLLISLVVNLVLLFQWFCCLDIVACNRCLFVVDGGLSG